MCMTLNDLQNVNWNVGDFPYQREGDAASWLQFVLRDLHYNTDIKFKLRERRQGVGLSFEINNRTARRQDIEGLCNAENGWRILRRNGQVISRFLDLGDILIPQDNDDAIRTQLFARFNAFLEDDAIRLVWNTLAAAAAPRVIEQAPAPRTGRKKAAATQTDKKKATVQDFIAFNERVQGEQWWIDHQELFVIQEEREILNDYNQTCTEPDFALTVGYPLEAVVGNPLTAEIVIFSNNPKTDVSKKTGQPISFYDRQGGNVDDEIWGILARQRQFWNAWTGENREGNPMLTQRFSAYNLDRRFVGAFGYWGKRLLGNNSLFRTALEQMGLNNGGIEANDAFLGWLSKHVAFIELFHYHSLKFDTNLASQDRNGAYRFPHVEYLFKLIERIFTANDKLIFFCRGVGTTYTNQFPVLQNAAFCNCINPLNPYFSTGNITCQWQYDPEANAWNKGINGERYGGVLAFLNNLFGNNINDLRRILG